MLFILCNILLFHLNVEFHFWIKCPIHLHFISFLSFEEWCDIPELNFNIENLMDP